VPPPGRPVRRDALARLAGLAGRELDPELRRRRVTTQHEERTETGGDVRRTRPMTGAEYIESLQDGREIWLYGEKVPDVTTHPAFRNMVRMTARLYDSLHDPDRQDLLTAPTDTGSIGLTHPFF